MAVPIINNLGGEITQTITEIDTTRIQMPEDAITFESTETTTTTTMAMTAPISIKRELEVYHGLSNKTPAKRRRTMKKQVHFGSFGLAF